MLYRDQGVVLRSIKLGETDRIVTVLGQGHGKVRAVAKGVRKPGSRFGARLEPTSHVAFQCYRGRGELDVVTQVETLDANRGLREHYGCLTHAVSMLEATDQVAQDREPNPALYRMLVGALRTLAAEPGPMVSTAFFWKLLSLEGFHPVLDECARCGDADGPFPAFDLFEGGVLCGSCAGFGGRRLPPETLALVRRILGGELRSALAEPPSASTADVERLALAALEHHLERRLRSAALL
ncbi:MAG TPA: DNA repair protein RecO [Acidimicrobiia bacterium]|jgi:DNA repair protein RecO (recombination protein O)